MCAIAEENRLSFGPFGKVVLYRQSPHPSHVVLFISGDGGWNLGVVDMARELSTLDTLVVGIDIVHYLRQLAASTEKCSYPAADFEALSKFVQKSLGFPVYVLPVLIGYSSGATLAYATLVQSPPNTFAGGVSMGFCPDLLLNRPLCRGYDLEWQSEPRGRGYSFLPAVHLETPWIALQGTIDQVCNVEATTKYVKGIPGAELVLLPKVGHGFSVPRNWMPQFRDAFTRLAQQPQTIAQPARTPTSDTGGLPLVEVPAEGSASDLLAVIVTGDGGWASIDRQIGNFFATKGIPVIGFNSLQYFWTPRTPEEAAQDLQRTLQHYLLAWKKEKVILVGYSFGADVLPFMADRLSPDVLGKVKLISLLGPGQKADFEFHLTDWLGGAESRSARPLLPEIEKLKGTQILCFFGEEEEDPLCKTLNTELATPVPLSGGHHFGGDYQFIAERILQQLAEKR